MFSSLNRIQSTAPLLSPTVFELDDEYYRRAKTHSATTEGDELDQWQAYLSVLALLACQDWLTESGVESTHIQQSDPASGAQYLHIGAFRLCLLSTEHCLSEQITFPRHLIQEDNWAAHFYLWLEVAEEQSEVWFRGLIRHDQLAITAPSESEMVTIPLTDFEPEPSRLLYYCRHLEANSLPLPQAATEKVSERFEEQSAIRPSPGISIAPTGLLQKLSQWLDTLADDGWQDWEALQPQLAYATRGLADGLKRGKLLNFTVAVGAQPVALVITLTPEADKNVKPEKVSILVQLLPTGSDCTLPPNLELSLISKKGKVLQQVTSRRQDNYIQLKSFKGTVGQCFGLKVQLEEVSVSEAFEI